MSTSLSNEAWQFAQQLLGRPLPDSSDAMLVGIAEQDYWQWLEEISTMGEASWDPAKHPRGAFTQNDGWFSPTNGSAPAESRLIKQRYRRGSYRDQPMTNEYASTTATQRELDAIVDLFKQSPSAKSLYDAASKVATDARVQGGLKIKVDANVPLKAGVAIDPLNAQVGFSDRLDLVRNKGEALESLAVELANLKQRDRLRDLENNINKLDRDSYITGKEQVEFNSVKEAAQIWKDSARDWGQDPKKMPSYDDPDQILRMSFDEHLNRLAKEHKEFYGQQWDRAHGR